jgi:hypothetical protein
MDIIYSLVLIYCQNHFNYKGCMDDHLNCIQTYALRNSQSIPYPNKPIVFSPEVVAEGYLVCTERTDVSCED